MDEETTVVTEKVVATERKEQMISPIESTRILKKLSQSIAEEDLKRFKETLKEAVHLSGNVSCLAKNAGLSRGTLYKAMQEGSDTGLGTLLKLFHALGMELVVTKKTRKSGSEKVRGPSSKTPIWKSVVSFFSRD